MQDFNKGQTNEHDFEKWDPLIFIFSTFNNNDEPQIEEYADLTQIDETPTREIVKSLFIKLEYFNRQHY